MLGRRWLYELKPYALDTTGSLPNDGATESTGRRDGLYKIQGLFVCKDYGADIIAVWKGMVDGYNDHMHQFYEKPRDYVCVTGQTFWTRSLCNMLFNCL